MPEREGSRAQCLDGWLRAFVVAGVPTLAALVALVYAPIFSSHFVPKTGLVYGLVGLLAGAWLGRLAAGGRLVLLASPLYAPMLAYLGVSGVALALAQNRLQGAEVLLLQAWLLVFCALVLHHFRSAGEVVGPLWVVVLTALVVALLGLLQYGGIHLIPHPKVYGNLPVSTLGNPNFVAHYLEVILPLSLALMAVRRRWWERGLLALVFVAGGIHLLLTQTRGGWLAGIVGLVVLLCLWQQRIRWRGWLAMALLVGALLSPAVELVLDSVRLGDGERLSSHVERLAGNSWERVRSAFAGDDFSVSQRRIIWEDTADLIGAHPWLGVGPGNYELELPLWRTVGRHREWREFMGERPEVAYQAHNDYLETWAESGAFGLAALLWLLGTLLWGGRRALASSDPVARALACGCLASLVATLVHLFFSFNLQDPVAAVHFWLLGGLLAVCGRGPEGGEVRLERSLGRIGRGLVAALGLAVAAGGLWAGLCTVMGDYYYFLGQKQQRLGQPNRASLSLREAIDWRSSEFRYHHLLGVVHLEADRPAEAVEALERSIELHPNNATALRLLGYARIELGRAQEAVPVLQRATRLAPLDAEAYIWLARAYQGQSEYDRAIETWKQVLAFAPEQGEYLRGLGLAYMAAGRAEEARAVLQQALQLRPEDAIVAGNLGAVYLKLRRLQEAETHLQAALRSEPERTEWWGNLALLYGLQQEPEKQRQALERAVEQEPEGTRWRLDLVQFYLDRGRLQEALAEAEKALGRDPRNESLARLVQQVRGRLERGEQ